MLLSMKVYVVVGQSDSTEDQIFAVCSSIERALDKREEAIDGDTSKTYDWIIMEFDMEY